MVLIVIFLSKIQIFFRKIPKNGFLWILEQIPGHVVSSDRTKFLKKSKYWPSYNIAYYKTINKLNGDEELAKKYGDW